MNRRGFITGSLAGGALVATGGIAWLSIDAHKEPLTIDFALQQLDVMLQKGPKTLGEWDLVQIFHHCAQSVEYSMTGYPEHKSALFKNTVGKAAFSAFSAKRQMSHALNEAIPGAPPLFNNGDINGAFSRFVESLKAFQEYRGELQPHFAYGALTKAEYEAAHVMHFNNHMNEIVFSNNLA